MAGAIPLAPARRRSPGPATAASRPPRRKTGTPAELAHRPLRRLRYGNVTARRASALEGGGGGWGAPLRSSGAPHLLCALVRAHSPSPLPTPNAAGVRRVEGCPRGPAESGPHQEA